MRRLIPMLLIGSVLLLFFVLTFYQPINVISTWNQLSPPENIFIKNATDNSRNVLVFSPLPPPGVPNFSPLPPPGVPNFSPLPPPGVPNFSPLPPPGVPNFSPLPPPGVPNLI